MPGLLSTAIRGAAAGKMAGMLEISSVVALRTASRSRSLSVPLHLVSLFSPRADSQEPSCRPMFTRG